MTIYYDQSFVNHDRLSLEYIGRKNEVTSKVKCDWKSILLSEWVKIVQNPYKKSTVISRIGGEVGEGGGPN